MQSYTLFCPDSLTLVEFWHSIKTLLHLSIMLFHYKDLSFPLMADHIYTFLQRFPVDSAGCMRHTLSLGIDEKGGGQ